APCRVKPVTPPPSCSPQPVGATGTVDRERETLCSLLAPLLLLLLVVPLLWASAGAAISAVRMRVPVIVRVFMTNPSFHFPFLIVVIDIDDDLALCERRADRSEPRAS